MFLTKCLYAIVATYREDPLQGKGCSPSPLVVTLVKSVCRASHDDTTDRPTHLQSSGAGTTKGQRHDLGSVSGGIGDEETPWDTLKSLTDDKKSKGVGLNRRKRKITIRR